MHATIGLFDAEGGVLRVGGQTMSALATRIGRAPFYACDRAALRRRVAEVRAVLARAMDVHNAMKANPVPALVALVAGLVDSIDVPSAGELQVVLDPGAPPAEIRFAGPGERVAGLHQAVAAVVLGNLESTRKIPVLARCSAELGLPTRVAVRVNPDFGLTDSGMKVGGGPRQFGVGQLLSGDPQELSIGNRQPHGRGRARTCFGGRASVHAAKSARQRDGACVGAARRPGRRVLVGGLRGECEPTGFPWASIVRRSTCVRLSQSHAQWKTL
jgi:hypothetical protein